MFYSICLFTGLIYGTDKQYYLYSRAQKVIEHEKQAILKYSQEILEQEEIKHLKGI